MIIFLLRIRSHISHIGRWWKGIRTTLYVQGLECGWKNDRKWMEEVWLVHQRGYIAPVFVPQSTSVKPEDCLDENKAAKIWYGQHLITKSYDYRVAENNFTYKSEVIFEKNMSWNVCASPVQCQIFTVRHEKIKKLTAARQWSGVRSI